MHGVILCLTDRVSRLLTLPCISTSYQTGTQGPAILLREGWRENGKVRKRPITNISSWPQAKGRDPAAAPQGRATRRPRRGLRHRQVPAPRPCRRGAGHAEEARSRQTDRSQPSERRNQVLAMIVARIIEPASKLATARGLAEATAVNTLGEILGAGLGEDRPLWRHGLAAGAPGQDRAGPGQAAPRGGAASCCMI